MPRKFPKLTKLYSKHRNGGWKTHKPGGPRFRNAGKPPLVEKEENDA